MGEGGQKRQDKSGGYCDNRWDMTKNELRWQQRTKWAEAGFWKQHVSLIQRMHALHSLISATRMCIKTDNIIIWWPFFLSCCWVTSVMSDSVQPHRRQPTRLPRPWDSPGKNTGVGCHFLLQCRKGKNESEVAQSCPTLRRHGLQPTRLLHPWDFPGKSTGVGGHCLLHFPFLVVHKMYLRFAGRWRIERKDDRIDH